MNIQDFLDRSAATEAFRVAVREFTRSGRSSPLLRFDLRSPTVKVERTITKVLESYPALAIEAVEIEGSSGCEYFRGEATIFAVGRVLRVEFCWDCRWKAQQLGWNDYFGFPDQARAAREFEYDCFRTWQEHVLESSASSAA